MMDLHETYNQIDTDIQNKQKLVLGNSTFSLKKLAIFFGIITFFIWYFYVVFFGNNSYQLVKKLKVEKQQLQLDIKELRTENSRLQRNYFNLKVADESYRDDI